MTQALVDSHACALFPEFEQSVTPLAHIKKENVEVSSPPSTIPAPLPSSENNINLNDITSIYQQVATITSIVTIMKENQKETNKLLQLAIEARQTNTHNTTLRKPDLPAVVYLKRKKILLISLQNKTSLKVWCTTCEKKVSIVETTNGSVQATCGHFTVCNFCKKEVEEKIIRCTCCNPDIVDNGIDTKEECCICGSLLKAKSKSYYDDDPLPKSFILINQSSPCVHDHTASSADCGKRTRAEGNNTPSTKRVRTEPPVPSSAHHYLPSIPSPIAMGVHGMKKALQVGSFLTSMALYNDGSEDYLFE